MAKSKPTVILIQLVVEGRKGSGKTTFGVGMAYNLKRLFARKALLDFGVNTEEFGEYFFLDEKKFLAELSTVSEVARGTNDQEVYLAVRYGLKKMGINLDKAIIVFDCRTPSDKLVRVFGYFIAQMRHYRNTVILLVPNRRYLDWRVKQQVDMYMKVAYNPMTEVVWGRYISPSTGLPRRLMLYGPHYHDMFDTHAPIAMRAKVLNVKG